MHFYNPIFISYYLLFLFSFNMLFLKTQNKSSDCKNRKSYSYSTTYSLSFSQADNGGGRWTQLLESFWATRLLSSIVIYCKRTLILREICHNTESARCVLPVVEASPRPLGHPVKHGDIYSLSYLGSHHLTLQRGREWKDLGWKSQT